MKSRIVRSLRFRIFLIICLTGILPCLFLRAVILKTYESRAISVNTGNITNQLTILADHLLTYNYLIDPSAEVINAELEQLSNLYDGRVLIIDSDLKVVKDTYSLIENKTIISEEVVKCFMHENTSRHDDANRYIEITTPITDRGSGDIIGVILSSVSTDSIYSTQNLLGRRAIYYQTVMAILIIVFAYFVSMLIVKPFRKMVEDLTDIDEGFEGRELSAPEFRETEALSGAFNKMISNMKQLDASRQEFVSNVSHELKTPITSIKVLADSLLADESVPIELYREFMADIVEEIDREDKIIKDLLSLVKLDRSAGSLNLEMVDINEMLEKILKRLGPIAATKNIELLLESIRPVSAQIDEMKLTLALSNLVENAIKYNKDNGWVKVTVDAEPHFFTVVVADSGMGIPKEAQAHIFERFYRVDKSHSREIGGTGLGLAITRNAILMHRGAIKVESEVDEGTVFTVKIPRS